MSPSSCCRPTRPPTPRWSSDSTRRAARPPSSTTRTSLGSSASARTALSTTLPSNTSRARRSASASKRRARCRSARPSTSRLQIANALVHASRRGVIHRDIKPSNIILTPQGRAKLVDMGLARRFERGGDRGLTQSGMTLGTFDYISPEQARDPRDVDVRSDLYSLGCTLFHMLTGRPPFPGGTVLQKLIQHQEEPPADVRSLNPDVPGRTGGDHRQADGQGARSSLPGARTPGPRPAGAGRFAGSGADAVRPGILDGARPSPVVGAAPGLAAARAGIHRDHLGAGLVGERGQQAAALPSASRRTRRWPRTWPN